MTSRSSDRPESNGVSLKILRAVGDAEGRLGDVIREGQNEIRGRLDGLHAEIKAHRIELTGAPGDPNGGIKGRLIAVEAEVSSLSKRLPDVQAAPLPPLPPEAPKGSQRWVIVALTGSVTAALAALAAAVKFLSGAG